MSLPLLPPKTEPLIDDDKFASINWLVFFDQVADGDFGTTWTPTFVGLTESGTATKTGIYYRISKRLVYFRIRIVPATSTSSTLGTTYCNNFPLTIVSDSTSHSTSGFSSGPAGITASDKRIYTASWTAITNPINITGILEVN